MLAKRVNALTLAGALLCVLSAVFGAVAISTRNPNVGTAAVLGLLTGAALLAGGQISA